MCVIDLEKQIKKCIEEGNIPFFVSATAGKKFENEGGREAERERETGKKREYEISP